MLLSVGVYSLWHEQHTHTHHSIILSQTGHVYAFGDGRQGQLGLGSTSSMLVPTVVSSLHDQTIAKVVCGSSHTSW